MILSVWLAAAAMVAGSDFQLQTTDGQTYYGDPVGLDAKAVEFLTPQERLTIPLSKLADVARVNKPAVSGKNAAVWVELIDGSQLIAAQYTVSDRLASLRLPENEAIELSTDAIRSVRFQQFNPDLSQQWAKIVEKEPGGDLIVIHKKGTLDYQAGVLGEITDTTVAFTLDDEKISVKRPKIAGLVYYHAAGKELPNSFCQLVDTAGSRLEIVRAKISEGTITVTTPAGFTRQIPLAQVTAITARVQYLSDLEPESASWRGYISGGNLPEAVSRWFKPRFNEALDGGELKIGGTVFAKGIAMSSRSELVYRLPPGEFKRLTATAGVDARGRPRGAVRLTIYGDEKILLETNVEATQEPQPIDLDLTGVNRLKIVADFGSNEEVMDFVDLVDARILQ